MSRQLACGNAEDDAVPTDPSIVTDAPNLDRLYRIQRQKMVRFLSRWSSHENAEDIVQQTFARYAELAIERRRSINCPAAYLHRAAENLVLDEAKSARRKSHSLHVAADDSVLPASDQVAALEARDMLRRVETAALKMRRLTREIFMAHRLDGYSYAEIAQRTGLSVKGVEKHMSKALAHLDRALGPR